MLPTTGTMRIHFKISDKNLKSENIFPVMLERLKVWQNLVTLATNREKPRQQSRATMCPSCTTELIKNLTLTLFQASLEASWSGLVEKLGGDGERAKAGKLQPALFNLYRQARQAERLKKKHSLSKNPCLLSLFSSVPSQCSVMGVQLLRMWFSSTRMVCLWKLRLVQSVY